VSSEQWRSERLRDDHDIQQFRSGNVALDRWLHFSASDADRSDNARTFVWSQEGIVVAYFALCPHVVRRSTLPGRWNRSGPSEIPSILLAKLALAEALHGRGLGEQLLIDAVLRSLRATAEVGGRFIIVDAINESAHRFYEHFGFVPLPGGSARLLMRTSDARGALLPLLERYKSIPRQEG
jgi:GNAT superfamily N-acetyltransferase